MNDFEEIMHSGGKVTIQKRGSGYSSLFEECSSNPIVLDSITLFFDGTSLVYKPDNIPEEFPGPHVEVLMGSDREGFFGRRCPNCKEYFRVASFPDYIRCPYCGKGSFHFFYMTDNQMDYIKEYSRIIIETALKDGDCDVVLDFDNLIDNLKDNTSPLVFSDESQQSKIQCSSCKFTYDIVGQYGFCPSCGKRNTFQIFNENMRSIIERFKATNESNNGETEKEKEYVEIVKYCVSEFEALGEDIKGQFKGFPMTDRRRKKFNRLKIQRIMETNCVFVDWFDIDLFNGITDDEKQFIKKMFNIRHLHTHRKGIVDKTYIKNTGDNTVRLGQIIRVGSEQTIKFIKSTKKIGKNLFNGYSSLKTV